MVLDAALRGAVGLIDVNPLSRPTDLGGPITTVGWCTADCVVEDENAVCSSAVKGYQNYTYLCGNMIGTHTSFKSCSISG